MLSYPLAVPLDGKLATKWCHPLELDEREESDPEGSLTQYIYGRYRFRDEWMEASRSS